MKKKKKRFDPPPPQLSPRATSRSTIAALAAAGSPVGCGNPIASFTIQQQQQLQWCWAAVTVSINWYYDHKSNWSQCIMANFEFDQHTCCIDGSTSACNRPYSLQDALNDTGNLKQSIAGPASYNSITNEIANCRPVGMGFTWKETDKPSVTGSHAFAITGYGEGLLFVNDPQGQISQNVDYSDLTSGDYPIWNDMTITSWDETDFTRRSPY